MNYGATGSSTFGGSRPRLPEQTGTRAASGSSSTSSSASTDAYFFVAGAAESSSIRSCAATTVRSWNAAQTSSGSA